MNMKEELELSKDSTRGKRAKIAGNLQKKTLGELLEENEENGEISVDLRNYIVDCYKNHTDNFKVFQEALGTHQSRTVIMPLEKPSAEITSIPLSTNYK